MNGHGLRKSLGLALLTVFVTATIAPLACLASTAGRRNTAIGLTAGTVYAAVKGKRTAAYALGAGSVYAWKRHSDARKNQAYRRGYNKGYHKGYNRGLHKGYYKGRHRYNKHYRH